jgi:hypothetical protein
MFMILPTLLCVKKKMQCVLFGFINKSFISKYFSTNPGPGGWRCHFYVVLSLQLLQYMEMQIYVTQAVTD